MSYGCLAKLAVTTYLCSSRGRTRTNRSAGTEAEASKGRQSCGDFPGPPRNDYPTRIFHERASIWNEIDLLVSFQFFILNTNLCDKERFDQFDANRKSRRRLFPLCHHENKGLPTYAQGLTI
jgi:hypothetical protein